MLDQATLDILLDRFVIGILIFVRISGLFAAAPFFKHTAIIPQVKIFLIMILSVIVTATFGESYPPIEFHLWYVVLLVIKEFMIGAAIGFSANVVFFGVRFAGGLIDFDMGYQTSNMFSQDETSPSLIGDLNELVALMLFLIINGHHYIIESIFISMKAVPLTTFAITESSITMLVKFATTVMIIGVKISAPILVSLFLTNLSLALLARVAPQTNIFILSFQIKIIVGLLVLISSVPIMVMVTKYALQTFETDITRFIYTLNPTRVF